MKHYILTLIVVIFLFGCATPSGRRTDNYTYESYIEYDTRDSITWGDFRANPDEKSSEFAEFNVNITITQRMNVWWGYKFLEVHGIMFPYKSWVKNIFKTNNNLEYLRAHFAIAELYARKIYTYIVDNDIGPNDVPRFTPMFDKYNNDYLKYIEIFEKKTNKSSDTIQLKYWIEKVKKEFSNYPSNGIEKQHKLF
jgi:hypothetical protein